MRTQPDAKQTGPRPGARPAGSDAEPWPSQSSPAGNPAAEATPMGAAAMAGSSPPRWDASQGQGCCSHGICPSYFHPFPCHRHHRAVPTQLGGAMRALLAARPPVPGHLGAPSLLPTAVGGVKARGARRDSRQHLPPPTAKGKGVWLIARVKYFSKNISFPPK